MNIEILKIEEIELLKSLDDNRAKQRQINKSDFIEKHKIDIGDTVEFKDGSKLKTGVISDILFSGVRADKYEVTLIKPDGKLGFKKAKIWSFMMPTISLIRKKS